VVKFIVARVDDQPDGGLNAQANPIGDGMADVEQVHLEGANGQAVASLHGVQVGAPGHAALGQLDLDKAAGQRSGIDGRLEFFQQVRQAAGVVFAPVGDDDAAHPLAVLRQVAEIGDDVVNAQHVVLGEHQTAVHHQNFAVIFIDHAVAAHFTEAPQWDDT